MKKTEIDEPVTCEFIEGAKANALGLKVGFLRVVITTFFVYVLSSIIGLSNQIDQINNPFSPKDDQNSKTHFISKNDHTYTMIKKVILQMCKNLIKSLNKLHTVLMYYNLYVEG